MPVDEMVYRGASLVGLSLGVLTALVLGTGHLTARVTDGTWPSYDLDQAPGIMGRLVTDPGDPAAAWGPVNSGGQPAGPLAWWLMLLVMSALCGLAVYYLARWLRRDNAQPAPADDHDTEPDEDEVSGFADRSGWQLGQRFRGPDADGGVSITVGQQGRRTVILDPLHSLLVVGPAHTGKTSAIAIPTLLEWPGPAVVASTKGHLMDATLGWRRRLGNTLVYDPAGLTGHPRAGWSPLADSGTWQGAIRMAQQLTAAAKASAARGTGVAGGGLQGGELWGSAMSMSLAPFLYAAAADGRSIVETAEWIEREERDEVLAILRPMDEHAAHVHETTFFRDDPARSAYFHTMYQVLSVYSDPSVAVTADRHDIDAHQLISGKSGRVDGGYGTLYLTAPEHDQSRFQPLFATIVRQVVTAVNEQFAASSGRPLNPPVLVLLDEAVGVAALQALAELASTGATKGAQVVSTFEDLDRLAGHPGDVPELLVRSHRAKLVLAGAAGLATNLVPEGTLAELEEDEGALVYEADGPQRVQLRRWHEDEELERRGTYGQQTANTSDGGHPLQGNDGPGYELVEEVGFLGRRRPPQPSPGLDADLATGPGRSGVDVGGRRVPSVDDILGRSSSSTNPYS